jgi:hypothetical protein
MHKDTDYLRAKPLSRIRHLPTITTTTTFLLTT